VKLREGYFREVRNNIFIGGNPPSKHACFEGSDDIYAHNIYVNTRDAWALNRGPSTAVLPIEIDRNVYFNTRGGEPIFGFQGVAVGGQRPKSRGLAFAEWKALGADKNSVFADPRFVDREGGDFRLEPDSPALELGFKPFPLDRFGTQGKWAASAARLRAAALGNSGDAPSYEWMGATIRTGSGGVLLVRVPGASAAHRAGFRENDTLTHINGVPAADVEALTGIISGAPIGGTRFLVRRGAQTEVILTPEPGGTPARISP
jgi:hypothetical protein